MSTIYNFSFYAADKYDHMLDENDLLQALKNNGWFKSCVIHQLHCRESKVYNYDANDPVFQKNCDLKELEKHFDHHENGNDSAEEIVIGGKYRHFKGNAVTVIAVARDTEYGGLSVIYHEPIGNSIWSRPIDMFLSDVDHDKYPDVQQKKRFELIASSVSATR